MGRSISSGKTEVTYRFGRCEIAPVARQLFVDGQETAIGSRAFDLLIGLIARRGTIVSKPELIKAVWPDVFVDDTNLRAQISRLRQVLQQDGNAIRNVVGRGYTFVAEVTQSASFVPPADKKPEDTPNAHHPRTNLPERRLQLVGRAAELDELTHRIGRGRLLTLMGPGGIGKTRLAIELGWQVRSHFPGGTWLIDLAAVRTGSQVLTAISAVLGVRVMRAETALEDVATALASREALVLILDNCEQVIEAVAEVVERFLARCPALSVIATSRESLRLGSENIYRLKPLSVPPKRAQDIIRFDAVALLVERAPVAYRDVLLAPVNVEGVGEICRGLQGIPLAIEMAAARLPVLGIAALRSGLGEQLAMLKFDPDLAVARHRSLRAVMEWSYNLLNPAERQIFHRLGIFAASFQLDAVIEVAGFGGGKWDAVDSFTSLADKSLVSIDGGEPVRYRLLDAVRSFAVEKLNASGERDSVAAHHANYLSRLFDEADTIYPTVSDKAWRSIYASEIDNARSALDWTLDRPDQHGLAVELFGSAVQLWYSLELIAEGRSYVDRVEPLIDLAPNRVVARLLFNVARLWLSSDLNRSLSLLERSVALFELEQDVQGVARVQGVLGSLLYRLGRSDEARVMLCAADDVFAGTDCRKTSFGIKFSLSALVDKVGDNREAQHYDEQALDLARALNDEPREAMVLVNQAERAFAAGNFASAIQMASRAKTIFRDGDRKMELGVTLYNLASYHLALNEVAAGQAANEEALALLSNNGGYILRRCLQLWGLIGALAGRLQEAATLTGFAVADQISGQVPWDVYGQAVHSQVQQILRASLSSGTIADLMARGARWTDGQAVRFTVDHLIRPGAQREPQTPDLEHVG